MPPDHSASAAPLPLKSYVSKPLQDAEHDAVGKTQLIIDVTNLIGGTPSYGTASSKAAGTQYTVVAICGSKASLDQSKALHVAVVETDRVTESVRKRIVNGDFTKALTCDKGEPYKA